MDVTNFLIALQVPTNRDYLDKLQRRAASIEGVKSSIKISAQLSAVRPWKIAENITLVFKSSNVYTNLRLLIFFIISAILLISTDTYNTRHKDQLRLPLARTKKYQTPFQYNGAKVWNTLP